MAIETAPLPLPPSADPSKFTEFGREVKGVNPGTLTAEQFKEVEELLYKVRRPHRLYPFVSNNLQHSALLFRNVDLSPEQQYALTKVRSRTSQDLPPHSPDPL